MAFSLVLKRRNRGLKRAKACYDIFFNDASSEVMGNLSLFSHENTEFRYVKDVTLLYVSIRWEIYDALRGQIYQGAWNCIG